MEANDVEYMLDEQFDIEESDFEESDLEQAEWEFSAYIRPQFRDASDFGRACRLLAIPVMRKEEFAAV